jgi:hypothetical protein
MISYANLVILICLSSFFINMAFSAGGTGGGSGGVCVCSFDLGTSLFS